MQCPRCQAMNMDGARFCNNCGNPFTYFAPPQAKKKDNTAAVVIAVAILGFCVLSSIAGSLFSRRSAPPPASVSLVETPASSRTPSSPSAAQPTPRTPKSKEELAASYKETVSEANPYLNFVKSKFTKVKGGQALWLVHSMFTQSSFDFGNDAKIVQRWIVENHDDLKSAGIVRVGFMNESGYLGSCYFDLK